MSNDLDDLDAVLRRAMAALEGETPHGYFEALPARTLARLDDPAIGDLPDDPGQLRAVQGQRLPADDDEDDDEVFSSQVMPAVKLPEPDEPPEPAKRVASAAGSGHGMRSASSVITVLPVPSGEPAMDATGSRPASAAPTPSSRASAGPVEPPASAAASMPSAELPGRRRSRRVRTAVVGIGGIGLAAVVVIYLAGVRSAQPTLVNGERAATASQPAAASPSAGDSSRTSVATGSVSAAQVAPAGGTASGSAAAAPAIAAGAGSSVVPGSAPGSASDAAPELIGKFAGPETKRPGNVKAPSKSGGKPPTKQRAGTEENAQQSPDKPGPSVKKIKSSKPQPDRTSLSSDDFERAMTAVAGKARACSAGTPGTASLRLTVAPSGRIAQITVTGPFASTPVGDCVVRAVQTVTFPPWDGAPQSFDYSYLLSD